MKLTPKIFLTLPKHRNNRQIVWAFSFTNSTFIATCCLYWKPIIQLFCPILEPISIVKGFEPKNRSNVQVFSAGQT